LEVFAQACRGAAERTRGSGSSRARDTAHAAGAECSGGSARDTCSGTRRAADRTTSRADPTGRQGCAGGSNAGDSQSRADSGACTELRAAGNQTVCDA
jgi:hypothetical protein